MWISSHDLRIATSQNNSISTPSFFSRIDSMELSRDCNFRGATVRMCMRSREVSQWIFVRLIVTLIARRRSNNSRPRWSNRRPATDCAGHFAITRETQPYNYSVVIFRNWLRIKYRGVYFRSQPSATYLPSVTKTFLTRRRISWLKDKFGDETLFNI